MKLYHKLLLFCAFSFSLSSCLKDDSLMDPDKTENVLEFANTANLTSPATSKLPLLSVNIVMDPNSIYKAAVNYTGAHTAPQDITVEVGVADSTVIKTYNTINNRIGANAYVMVPANLYTIPSTKVVIPKGTQRVDFPIVFPSPDLLYGKNYVIPLTIKSASSGVISGNFGTMLYLLTGINRTDGTYTLKFRFGGNDRGYDLNANAWYYADVLMVTTGPTTAVLRNPYTGASNNHASVSSGLPTFIAGFIPQFTIDPASNKITNIINSSAGTKTAVPNPAVTDNRFDPSTKNLYASFILKETGKPDMIINDTLIYKSPR